MENERKASCEEISSLIIGYIDGELDVADAELVARHIKECADCRKLYSDMLSVCRAAAESAYKPPRELHARVMSAVRAEKTGRARRTGMKRVTIYAGIGIAAMLCISIGITAMFKHLVSSPDSASAGTQELCLTDGAVAKSAGSGSYIFNNSGSEFNEILRSNAYYSICVNPTADTKGGSDETKAEESTETTDKNAVSNETSPATTAAELPETTCVPCSTGAPGINVSDASNAFNLIGEWYLSSSDGKQVVLVFYDTSGFKLTDTAGRITTGDYEATGSVISFIYYGNTSKYSYNVYGSELSLTHLSGDLLIR